MEIICDKCQSKFRIPDEKIPAGKSASLPCPKCKNKITVTATQKPDPPAAAAKKEETSHDETAAVSYDASEKPFDFVEEEGKTVLVCESDPAVKKTIKSALTHMEYHITDPENTQDALTKMRYHVYDLILVNERFDTDNPDKNGVLTYLEHLHMGIRRNIFVCLISHRFRTADNMMAFNKSVNMVLNVKDIGNIDKVLGRGITENDFFYRIYKELLRKTGRI